jgi:hypothetical protein
MIRRPAQDRPELQALLAEARRNIMTEAETEAQRKSFVIGELMLAHPELTREEAEARYERAKRNFK